MSHQCDHRSVELLALRTPDPTRSRCRLLYLLSGAITLLHCRFLLSVMILVIFPYFFFIHRSYLVLSPRVINESLFRWLILLLELLLHLLCPLVRLLCYFRFGFGGFLDFLRRFGIRRWFCFDDGRWRHHDLIEPGLVLGEACMC